ncbi:uncharacterized protein qsm [Chironomus tepperi]|uniref:uncharacterized protein qsm n=1 Tax=Chironomus tepperi TaxID=113505 RepID=UPI00391F4123
MYKKLNLLSILLCGFLLIGSCHAKGQQHKVQCTEDVMKVLVALPDNNTRVYLEGLNGYKIEKCEPKYSENLAVFELSLINFYDCGLIRVVNKLTDIKTFYHKIVIESGKLKQLVSVKCITQHRNLNSTVYETHSIVRRDVLPAGFEEPTNLDITTVYTEKAPEPVLGVGVRQNGNLISDNLNVSPGTPLQMEIFLDRNSSSVYGLGVNYMQVSDTRSQEETIIFNGCSVDPFLFDNFATEDGDFLTAKFRAFKFPDSNYVQFRGTVNVCLDKCKGVECADGKIGYGKRRKREVSNSDSNKLYEINLSTFIKVDYEGNPDTNVLTETEENLKNLKLANQKLNRNSRENVFESIHDTRPENLNSDTAKVEETSVFTRVIENFETSGAPLFIGNTALITLVAVILNQLIF